MRFEIRLILEFQLYYREMDMFTNLQNILNVLPRHAEHTDARQDIRRQDPDNPSGGRDEAEADTDDFVMQDDHAVVSVAALKVFLENFLRTQQDQAQAEIVAGPAEVTQAVSDLEERPAEQGDSSLQEDDIVPDVPREQTVRAVRAYQHTAEATQGPRFDTADSGNSEALLGGEDVRVIHQLLTDIQALQGQRVEYLKIEKADTFLQSLVAAVAAASSFDVSSA